MHISEGVLKPEILVGGAIVSTVFIGFSLKKLQLEEIPKTAVFAAVFFLASFIHVPIGVTSVHLILSGLVGVFLGFNGWLAIFIALFFQGVLFGYGGLTTLGINTFILASPSIIAFYLIQRKYKNSIQKRVIWFLTGFLPIFLSALLLSLTLMLNGESFFAIASLAFISNLPIMVIEGLITLFALEFIQKVSPELLQKVSS